MALVNISYPQVVFKQATAPTAIAGRLWLDTDTNQLFYYNGSSWTELGAEVSSNIYQEILQNALDILELEAEATLDGGQSASMVRDVFSDADGYLDSVDTGNTTATFETDKYANGMSETTITQDQSIASTVGTSLKNGMKIHANTNFTLNGFKKGGSSTSTTGYILDSSKNVITSAAFVGQVVTFSADNDLVAGNDYYLATDSGGASRTMNYASGASYPVNGTYFNWTTGLNDGADNSGHAMEVLEAYIEITPSDLIVQSDAVALGSTPTHFQVFAWKPNTTGTGEIDCDISFDNGSNYQEGVALDTPTAITNTGSTMILKLNLGAGASNGLAEADGYGVMFW